MLFSNKFLNTYWKVTALCNQQSIKYIGGKNTRGIRVSSHDPDEPSLNVATAAGVMAGTMQAGNTGTMSSKTLGNQRKFVPGQRVATISQNYNEKTMLLSSDDEYQ